MGDFEDESLGPNRSTANDDEDDDDDDSLLALSILEWWIRFRIEEEEEEEDNINFGVCVEERAREVVDEEYGMLYHPYL